MVQEFSREFVLSADVNGQPAHVNALAALDPRFSWAPAGRSRTLRRTWLDTFDWRLHRAGLTLEHVAGASRGELTLTGTGMEPVTAHASRRKWPALTDALPPGPLQARLRALAELRALMPIARAVSAVQEFRVLNADDKTVAWLTLDRMSVTYPAVADPPSRLRITAVRGYQAQAERAGQILARAPGVRPRARPALDTALAAAGRRPREYTNKINVRLTAEMPARTAMTKVLLRLLDTLESNVGGTIRDVDTEFLHDLRVAVRRTRSALKLAGDVLPADLSARYRPEFKWLGDLTTPTRDLDVYLLNYPRMADGLLSATPEELEPFHVHLTRSRSDERRALVRGLRSARFSRLACGWRAALTGARPPPSGPVVAELAADRIRRAHRRVLRQGRAIGPDSPPESLHDLRKRCKELRYLLEFFASLHDPEIHRLAVRELKGLQDCLGEFQDCQVQQHEIRVFAAQMMEEREVPATALLAMGELAGRVGLREQRARSEFAGRFSDFASAGNQDGFGILVTAAAS